MIKVYSLRWAPPMVRGFVRDVRVRWALEEAHLPYENELVGPTDQKPDGSYREIQPFGQVPGYVEDDLILSESGGIVHHIALKSEALMPREPDAQARVVTWMFAALNSVEPFVGQLAEIDVFAKNQEWTKERRPTIARLVNMRLDALVTKLEGKEYLCDRFTAADVLMAHTLRLLKGTEFLTARPVLASYLARCEARPAYQKALADHLASFDENAAPKPQPS